MNTHGHESIRSLIERSFCETLPSTDWAVLRSALDDCTGCRNYYEELAELDRTLAGGAEWSPVSHDRVWRLVADELGAEPRVARRPRLTAMLSALTAVGLAALVTLAVTRDGSTPDTLPTDEEFTARSGIEAPAELGVTVFSIDPVSRSVERAAGDAVEISSDRVIQFALTAREPGRVFLVGRDAEGRLHWYHPGGEAPADGYAVTGDEVENPVGPSWSIEEGTTEVFAILANEGASAGRVAAALAGDFESLEALGVVARVRIEVLP